MLPSVSRIGGNESSATAIMASTTFEASPVTLKLPAAQARRSSPTGVSSYAGNGSALTSPAPKFVPVGPGSTSVKRMPNGSTSLATASTKPSMPHFCRVIKAEARIGHLAAFGGDLQYTAATLTAQMRKTCADQRDRADKVRVDLPVDLIVGNLLCGAEQTVAGV